MFDQIKKNALTLVGDNNIRDWGYSIVLRSDRLTLGKEICSYREKFLVLKPKKSITLESHVNYSEVWTADGIFEYILEDKNGQLSRYRASKFERIFIPKGRIHKIVNSNKICLNIFEIQVGEISDNDKVQYIEGDNNV